MRTAMLLALLLTGGTTLAYEEPRYEVTRTTGEFEVRRYAPVLIAETAVETEANFQKAERALRDALRKSGATAVGEPLYAVYNGPWTPPFLRRNEVLIPVRE